MIFFKRRRYFYWLIKAYFKKWGKNILFFFFFGLFAGVILFFLLRTTSDFLISKIPTGDKETIGMVGAYTIDSLPSSIFNAVSTGLTKVSETGEITPGIARGWKIDNNGKTYIFYLKNNLRFNDGENITSDSINYSFKDVTMEKPDKYIVVFKLKDTYSPFLVTLSGPIFKDGLVGIGEYRIKNIKTNGTFIKSLTIISRKNSSKIKTYEFYPSQEALKVALALGEITKAEDLSDIEFNKSSFDKFPNLKVVKKVDENQLVTLFFNNEDRVVSDKRIRTSLSYAIPDEFSNGKRTFSPFSYKSWAYNEENIRKQDLEHARIVLDKTDSSTNSAALNLTIKTMAKYKNTAEEISAVWKKIGIKTKIEIVDSIPDSYQILLSDFNIPLDPDQYTIWHSDQNNNITNYKNLRIDKLLEDGRKIFEIDTRKKIYADFQKYLIDDSPAIFLYFPYKYEVSKK